MDMPHGWSAYTFSTEFKKIMPGIISWSDSKLFRLSGGRGRPCRGRTLYEGLINEVMKYIRFIMTVIITSFILGVLKKIPIIHRTIRTVLVLLLTVYEVNRPLIP
jgi:hypothetical protein